MPTSYIIKPLPMFISWLLLITTTVPKFVDYLHISRSFCTKMHLSAMVFMMLLFSPVASLVQLISTVFTSHTVTIAESYSQKRTVLDGLKLQNALSLLDSMEIIQNHYGEDPRLARPTGKTLILNTVTSAVHSLTKQTYALIPNFLPQQV